MGVHRGIGRRALRAAGAVAVGASVAGAGVLAGAGAAGADEWPEQPDYPSPTAPQEFDDFLTPEDADFWNPTVDENRLTSPYGTDTRIVCESFHGVLLDCWQADEAGEPHKLERIAMNPPASLGANRLPGGGPSHFVYPDALGSALAGVSQSVSGSLGSTG